MAKKKIKPAVSTVKPKGNKQQQVHPKPLVQPVKRNVLSEYMKKNKDAKFMRFLLPMRTVWKAGKTHPLHAILYTPDGSTRRIDATNDLELVEKVKTVVKEFSSRKERFTPSLNLDHFYNLVNAVKGDDVVDLTYIMPLDRELIAAPSMPNVDVEIERIGRFSCESPMRSPIATDVAIMIHNVEKAINQKSNGNKAEIFWDVMIGENILVRAFVYNIDSKVDLPYITSTIRHCAGRIGDMIDDSIFSYDNVKVKIEIP